MATRTIVTCDLCHAEIKPGARVISFSAIRYADTGNEWPPKEMAHTKFDRSEFCSDGCALNAVRGLLNGTA